MNVMMHWTKFLLMAWRGPVVCQGQTGFFFGLSAGVNNTQVLNKDDQNSDVLKSKLSFGPQYGILAGYNISETRHNSITIEVNSITINQKYEGFSQSSATLKHLMRQLR
jgi:hypothetical protein